VFTDGFQELEQGDRPYFDLEDPAFSFNSRRGTIGDWSVASSLREEGFENAWVIKNDGNENYLAQTFTNLNKNNAPLSLVTHPLIVSGDSLWNDYTIEVEFTPQAKFDKCGVVFKYRNPADFYFFGIEGNTVTLKQIEQSVTPLRPIERILDIKPLVWTPGERLYATITVRRNKVSTILNDSISMHAENLSMQPGRIGLISDIPASFHKVEVKLLKGEQRQLARRKRQLARKTDLGLKNHPKMVRWKHFETSEAGSGQNIRLGDLTGDGNKEIVFIQPGVSATSVGCLCVMNLDGKVLWDFGKSDSDRQGASRELPVQIHDLDGDGAREVILISEGWIYVLEGKSGKVRSRSRVPGDKFINSLSFGDLLGTGRDNCLLLSDRNHVLIALNERLELLWEQTTPTGSQPVLHDLDGDGRHEVLMGYSVFGPEGTLKYDVGAYIGDVCNGILVQDLLVGEEEIPSLVYAAGDWGILYFDTIGNLIKQNIMGHVSYMSVADYDVEIPGLELITSNQWGSDGMVHVQDASGKVINNFLSVSGVSRCQPVNWKGDGEEFLLTSADSLMGGMFDRKGQLAVSFPTDGHPVTYYMVQDLMGDTRDEIMVWDQSQLWIYTQDDNPRMGNTYAPAHIPLYNYSLHQMNRSLPGW